MSIEFHCSECYAKVITPDETAGKQGKCPHCTAVIRIPERNPAAAPIAHPQPAPVVQQPQYPQVQHPQPVAPNQDPFKPTGTKSSEPQDTIVEKQFGFDRWEQQVDDGTWGEDTTLSYKMRKMVAEERAKNRLVGPAQAMVVTATINLIIVAIGILLLVCWIVYQLQYQHHISVPTVLTYIVILGVQLMVSAMIMIGGNHLMRARSYSVAYTGAIFAILPLNALFFATIPIGVWAIMTLNDTVVGEGFKRR